MTDLTPNVLPLRPNGQPSRTEEKTRSGSRPHPPTSPFTVWRVDGETWQDSTAGGEAEEATWLYFTDASYTVPDLNRVIRVVRGRRRDWCRVDRVERLGRLPASLARDLFGSLGVAPRWPVSAAAPLGQKIIDAVLFPSLLISP